MLGDRVVDTRSECEFGMSGDTAETLADSLLRAFPGRVSRIDVAIVQTAADHFLP